MKIVHLLTVTAWTLALSGTAFAGEQFARIDLTRHFIDHSFNLLGDGLSPDTSAVEIVFTTNRPEATYSVEVIKTEFTRDTVDCPAPIRIDQGVVHKLHVSPTTEYDDGSSCVYRIRLEDGRTASIEFYSVGT